MPVELVQYVGMTEMHVSRSAVLFAKAQVSLPRECRQILEATIL